MSAQGGGLAAAWYRGDAWLWLLRPLEIVFRSLVLLRRQLYSTGLLNTWQSPKPLVVVGNITVGGTGKTPIVIALVEALQAQGIRPGVVSRGYGATAKAFPHCVDTASTASQCGDEPLLIHRRTGVPCVVDPVRIEAVKALLQQFDVDVVLSDDGLQHYALGRDMEIAVLDATLGTGNGFCLPAGPLREPASRLQTVDVVLHRNGENPESAVWYEQDGLVSLQTGEQRSLQSFAGDAVYAVAGIGQPAQFFDTLLAAGVQIQSRVFPDHHSYCMDDFAGLTDKAILMTEKDAVKCASMAGDNAWYLRISAHLPEALVTAVAQLARR
jgi:tetraacyldisaccharide 4'-kinase